MFVGEWLFRDNTIVDACLTGVQNALSALHLCVFIQAHACVLFDFSDLGFATFDCLLWLIRSSIDTISNIENVGLVIQLKFSKLDTEIHSRKAHLKLLERL